LLFFFFHLLPTKNDYVPHGLLFGIHYTTSGYILFVFYCRWW
jgi:hypothetical protein